MEENQPEIDSKMTRISKALLGLVVSLCYALLVMFIVVFKFIGSIDASLLHPCPKGRKPSAKTCPKFCFKESFSVTGSHPKIKRINYGFLP